jgi:hypothetical protein
MSPLNVFDIVSAPADINSVLPYPHFRSSRFPPTLMISLPRSTRGEVVAFPLRGFYSFFHDLVLYAATHSLFWAYFKFFRDGVLYQMVFGHFELFSCFV